MLKNGFKIENGEIYDTKILTYVLKKKHYGANIIYFAEVLGYKRLYRFEPLLDKYSPETVFKLLSFNKYLKQNREKQGALDRYSLDNASNFSIIYNFPPSYLTAKKFAIYKKCQNLKRRIY